MSTRAYLENIMKQYTTDNVEDPEAFEKKIRDYLTLDNWEMEGYSEDEIDVQRELSIKFHWGHNHDFGSFKLDGKMGDRHIDIISTFIDTFGLPRDLSGKAVLDVGVWTGGTTLLLAGMGADVHALEEVRKYSLALSHIASSFGIGQYYRYDKDCEKRVDAGYIHHLNISLYKYNPESFFDYVIFPGVLYHLSDPIVALRILFNALKDGGTLFIETAYRGRDFHDDLQPIYYWGPQRPGYNWFLPSPEALDRMLVDVGFDIYEDYRENGRLFTKAVRHEWRPFFRSGLSRNVR